jgi:hypothetical protein
MAFGLVRVDPLQTDRRIGLSCPIVSALGICARYLRARRLVLLIAVALGVMAAAGCQVKVAVHTQVGKDGRGTVTVGVGLDDKALSRAGNLDTEAKTDDLVAAGWTVGKATKEADGLTWIRVSKDFRDATELNQIMADIAGPGMFRDFTFETTETDAETDYRLNGTVDASKGLAPFSDPELTAKLNGDPFGGNIQAIEADEGRPIADMVSFDVSASVVQGPVQVFHPTLRDTQPTPVDIVMIEPKPPPLAQSVGLLVVIGVAGIFVVIMLIGVRRRFRRARH